MGMPWVSAHSLVPHRNEPAALSLFGRLVGSAIATTNSAPVLVLQPAPVSLKIISKLGAQRR